MTLTVEERDLVAVLRSLDDVHRQRLRFAAQSIANDQVLARGGDAAIFCNGCICWKQQHPANSAHSLEWPD